MFQDPFMLFIYTCSIVYWCGFADLSHYEKGNSSPWVDNWPTPNSLLFGYSSCTGWHTLTKVLFFFCVNMHIMPENRWEFSRLHRWYLFPIFVSCWANSRATLKVSTPDQYSPNGQSRKRWYSLSLSTTTITYVYLLLCHKSCLGFHCWKERTREGKDARDLFGITPKIFPLRKNKYCNKKNKTTQTEAADVISSATVYVYLFVKGEQT